MFIASPPSGLEAPPCAPVPAAAPASYFLPYTFPYLPPNFDFASMTSQPLHLDNNREVSNASTATAAPQPNLSSES